jgi:hypothetical protein
MVLIVDFQIFNGNSVEKAKLNVCYRNFSVQRACELRFNVSNDVFANIADVKYE